MAFTSKTATKVVPKLAEMLRAARQGLNEAYNKGNWFSFPVEQLYVNFSIDTLLLRQQHGNDLDLKHLLQSTPQLKTYSTSLARKIKAHDHNHRFFLDHKKIDLRNIGAVLSASEVCHMRSGIEFLYPALEDVPVLKSKRRCLVPFRTCYGRVYGYLQEFDEELKKWASVYQFLEDDVIPTNIPIEHWWWEITALDKPKEVFDFLDYKEVIIKSV